MLRRTPYSCRFFDVRKQLKDVRGNIILPSSRGYTRKDPFCDQVKSLVTSGTGGNGNASMMHIMNNEFAGPGGGTGGRGGHVIVQCNHQQPDLHHIKALGPRISAGSGAAGGFKKMTGKNGQDLIVDVPKGTVITDVDTNEVIHDFVKEGEEILLLEGGTGGKGNASLTTAMLHTPEDALKGIPGNAMLAHFELKLMADVGLVGFPNAGKSSFLSAATTSKPKIAPYPFTTLNPFVGQVHCDWSTTSIADLPGLIEGSYENRGLGHQFLRHVERTGIIAIVLDMTCRPFSTGEPPLESWEQIEALESELEFFQPGLGNKIKFVFCNKMDVELDVFGQSIKTKVQELRRRVETSVVQDGNGGGGADEDGEGGIKVFEISAKRALHRGPNADGFQMTQGLLEVAKLAKKHSKAKEKERLAELADSATMMHSMALQHKFKSHDSDNVMKDLEKFKMQSFRNKGVSVDEAEELALLGVDQGDCLVGNQLGSAENLGSVLDRLHSRKPRSPMGRLSDSSVGEIMDAERQSNTVGGRLRGVSFLKDQAEFVDNLTNIDNQTGVHVGTLSDPSTRGHQTRIGREGFNEDE